MHLFRVALPGALQLLQQSFPSASCFGKKSRAVRVLVCCSPVRFTSLPLRNALASAMTWKASAGLHLVASSRMRVPFGYSQSSPDTSATTSRIVPVNLMSSYEPAAGSVAEPAAGADQTQHVGHVQAQPDDQQDENG